MINQDDRELVQAGVDGELDAEGRARLDALLNESEAARALNNELESLTAFIERLPPVEPPDDLHARVMNSISLRAPSRLKRFFSFQDLPAVVRYGLAATAAVVLTVAVYQGGSDFDAPSDYADMVGTIARGGPVAGGRVIDQLRFDASSASGSVRLLERDGVYALEFKLDSTDPVQFDVDLAGNGLAFDAFARQDQELEAVSWTGESLSARARGQQRFVILMRRDEGHAASGSKIGLTVSRQGEAIHEGWLEPGW